MISWLTYDPQKEVAALEIPILIIGGTADSQVPAADAERLYAAHPESELLIIDDMNHVVKIVSNEGGNKVAYSTRIYLWWMG